eukprot:5448067-Alexandrium_andersonii.AAC.1
MCIRDSSPPAWAPEQPLITSLVGATTTAEVRVVAQDWAAPTVRAEILRAVAARRQAGVTISWTSQTIRPGAQPGWSGGDVGGLA